MLTPLANALSNQSLPQGDYCGVQTIAGFGNVVDELAALRSGCAAHDLGWLAFLKVASEDRVRWLNGMVTNNTRDLAPGQGNYNFVLSTQGRILGDLMAYQRGDHYLLVTADSQRSHMIAMLNKYIIMDDVELSDITQTMTAIGITGPHAIEKCVNAGLPAVESQLNVLHTLTWNGGEVTFVRSAESPVQAFQLWLAPENVRSGWDALLAAGATPAGSSALEKFRVQCGIPMYGKDIREKELPQETGQEHALNFTKGCYVGQEIVERIRSRGIVHRMFAGFVLSAEPVQAAAGEQIKIQHDGKDVGYVTSFEHVPVNGNDIMLALGYIRREAAAPGAIISIGPVTGTVSSLPFAG